MDDPTRKNPQESSDLKDLPPKTLGKEFEANVKGGVTPINDLKRPRPAEPIND